MFVEPGAMRKKILVFVGLKSGTHWNDFGLFPLSSGSGGLTFRVSSRVDLNSTGMRDRH